MSNVTVVQEMSVNSCDSSTVIYLQIFDGKSCVNDKPSLSANGTNPFCDEHVDVSNFLNMHSQQDYSSFCLSYAMTFRDFVGGTLGLAWVSSEKNCTNFAFFVLKNIFRYKS